MRDDIYGTLKNAIERGTPIENAVKSLVNAGYKELDVIEAVQAIQIGLAQANEPPQQTKQQTTQKFQPIRPPQYVQQPVMRNSSGFNVPLKKGPSPLIIFLVLILLISIAGFIVSLVYREQIATFLQQALA